MAKRYKTVRQDFFPNYMSWKIIQAPNDDDYTTDKIFTPIPRNQTITGNKAVVMELLWLDVSISNLTLNTALENVAWGIQTGATPTGQQYIDDGNVIASSEVEISGIVQGGGITVQPFRYNFQTTDGFGILLATDAFHSWVNSLGTTVKNAAHFRLYYRFVQIPVTEYIGIVQSQQTS